MTEYEAYDIAINLVRFSHELGESILQQIQFWAGVSYALLAITLIAADKLTIGISTLLLVLYVAFSIDSVANVLLDLQVAKASLSDANTMLEANSLFLEAVDEKYSHLTDNEFKSIRRVAMYYAPGLFIGTLGYLVFSTLREDKRRKESRD